MSESAEIDLNTFLQEFERAAIKASNGRVDSEFIGSQRRQSVDSETSIELRSPVERLLAWSKRKEEKLERIRREEENRRLEEEAQMFSPNLRKVRCYVLVEPPYFTYSLNLRHTGSCPQVS